MDFKFYDLNVLFCLHCISKKDGGGGGRFQGLDIEDDGLPEDDDDDSSKMVTNTKKNKKDKKKKQAESASEITETVETDRTAADNDHKNGDTALETNDDNASDEPNVSTAKKSKKKKKDKKDFDFDFEDGSGDEKVKPPKTPESAAKKLEDVPDESDTIIKTAAQKRAEKKEREKKKKEAEKAKAKSKVKREENTIDTKVDDKTEEGSNIDTELPADKEREDGVAASLSGTCKW